MIGEVGAELRQFLLDLVEPPAFVAFQPDAGQLSAQQSPIDDAPLGLVQQRPLVPLPDRLECLVDWFALLDAQAEPDHLAEHRLVGFPQGGRVLHPEQMRNRAPGELERPVDFLQRLHQAGPCRLNIVLQILEPALRFGQHLPNPRNHVLGSDLVESGQPAGHQQRVLGRVGFLFGHRWLPESG